MMTTLVNDRFRINVNDETAFIGQGGMGTVYRGLDTMTDTPVAIKVLKSELVAHDSETVQRFELEGDALRQLNHPGIVKMLAFDTVASEQYLVMEYVQGGSLRDVLDSEKQLTMQRSLYIALDVADALTRAHRLNILHRDIKPDNVLIADDGTPRLTDFGMARMKGKPSITQEGMIVGTLAYLAPEIFEGKEPDERTDIWAFGVMLYEMLVGERPFPYNQPGKLINAIMTHPIPDLEAQHPELSTALIDLLYRMLSKERDARIPSVRQVGAELESILRGDRTTSLQPVVSVDDSTGRFNLDSDIPVMPIVETSRIVTFKAPNNLPNPPTPFVGREDTMCELQELLAGDTNLMTLVGPGGIGKTRLALALAERQLEVYHDGVYFIPTAALDNSDYVIGTINEALGFTPGGTDDKQELINYLREKKMLLIFDNFEHLLDASDIFSSIVQAAPAVTIIVTSRERLRLRGEQVYEVDGMKLPAPDDETPEGLADFAAVKLFVQSARRNLTDFEIDSPEVAHDVAEIIRLVGGMPLGVELAAAWLESLPLDEIINEIGSNLDFLETDLRDVPERHRSIRAVFDYSWHMMTEAEQEIFKKLSVFRGGFEREAAQKVTGASLRALTTLVNKSLLSRDPDGRYHVQKMLRQYAEDRLREDPDVLEQTYTAHCEYYAAFTSKLSESINSAKENAAIEILDREHENIRLTWMRGIERQHYNALDVMQDTLIGYYLAHSWLKEGYTLFKSLADAMEKEGFKDSVYWRARVRQTWFATRMGNFDNVLEITQNAINFYGDSSFTSETAHAFNQMSYLYMIRGDYEQAKEMAQRAIEGIVPQDDPLVYFMAMGNLGYAYYLAGELREARRIYEQLLNHETIHLYSISGQAYFKNNLGEILRDMGEMSRALELFEEADAIFKTTNRKRAMAFTRLNIGGIMFMQGDFEKAKEAYQETYELYRDVGDRNGLAHALSNLGNSLQFEDHYEEARKNYEQSLAIRRETGDKRGIADSLGDLAMVNLNMGQLDEAIKLAHELIEIRIEIGDRQGEGMAYGSFATALMIHERSDEAREYIDKAFMIGEETGNAMLRARTYGLKGELAYLGGDYDTALAHYKESLRLTDVEPLMLFSLIGIAQTYTTQEKNDEALEIISLVMRYPFHFYAMFKDRIDAILEELKEKIDAVTIETQLDAGKTMMMNKLVASLLET